MAGVRATGNVSEVSGEFRSAGYSLNLQNRQTAPGRTKRPGRGTLFDTRRLSSGLTSVKLGIWMWAIGLLPPLNDYIRDMEGSPHGQYFLVNWRDRRHSCCSLDAGAEVIPAADTLAAQDRWPDILAAAGSRANSDCGISRLSMRSGDRSEDKPREITGNRLAVICAASVRQPQAELCWLSAACCACARTASVASSG